MSFAPLAFLSCFAPLVTTLSPLALSARVKTFLSLPAFRGRGDEREPLGKRANQGKRAPRGRVSKRKNRAARYLQLVINPLAYNYLFCGSSVGKLAV